VLEGFLLRGWRWILIAALLSVAFYIVSQTEAMGGLMRFIRNTIARITASVAPYHSHRSEPSLITLRTGDDATLKGVESKEGSQGIYATIIKNHSEEPSSELHTRGEEKELDWLFSQVESLLVEEDQNAYDAYDQMDSAENGNGEKEEDSGGGDLKDLDELWSQIIGDDFPYPDPYALNDLYYEEEQWTADEPVEDLRSMINDEVESELRRIISDMLKEERISNPDQLLKKRMTPDREGLR